MPSTAPASFSGDWITPSHPDYQKAIARWAANAERRAKVVAFVKSAADVAVVLEYAHKQKLPVAVRGGGHSAAGASSVEDGIVVDLSRYLGEAKVDAAKKLAYVGGGAIWGTVDKATAKYGLATVAGTVSHTGVGGLILGGGYGYLSGEQGLVLDNLIQATVVTANGEILTASLTENPELFWGLRGGGCNFGVATEFVLQLHPQRPMVFAGLAMFPGSALEPLMSVFRPWYAKGLDPREAIMHGLTKGPDGSPVNLLIFFWNGSEEEARAHFKPFFDIGPFLDTCKEIPYHQVNALMDEQNPYGGNHYMKGLFVSEPLRQGAQEALDTIVRLSTKEEADIMFLFEYLPMAKINAVPKAAVSHIRGYRVNCLALASWKTSTDVKKLEKIRDAVHEISDIIMSNEKNIPKDLNTGYGNYASAEVTTNVVGSRVPAEALFGDHYPRLQALKKKYDPEMRFSRWAPITPA
ncbi:FAD-binding domain-containing protein [Mycena floridula]|nr:FAD-binding domain-containing protein [Mycena floridula]